MSRKLEEDTIRKHVVLYRRDWERILEIYGKSIGGSQAVRRIVRAFLINLDAKTSAQAKRPQDEIEIGEIGP